MRSTLYILHILLLLGMILVFVFPQTAPILQAGPHSDKLGNAPTLPTEGVKKTGTSWFRRRSTHPQSVAPIQRNNRAAVARLYKTKFAPYIKTRNAWTGSVSSCRAGRNSTEYDQATLIILNYFRAMAGLAGDVIFRSDYNEKAQKAALIMEAKNNLSHSPPSSWPCYSSAGAKGAGSSNLCLGCVGPYAISAYMDDRSIKGVGHRQWVLGVGQKVMGTGSSKRAHALYVFGEWKKNRPKIEYVAWPGAGYMPYQFGLDRGYPWSFQIQGRSVDSSGARVSMTHKGRRVSLRKESGRGSMIVWYPRGFPKGQQGYGPYKPKKDYAVDVQIRNVKVKGVSKEYSYRVVFIDPEKAGGGENPVVTPTINPALNRDLIIKVDAGQESAVTDLLSRGADPNAKFQGWSALMYAAYGGHARIVRLLLKQKADPNYGLNSWTPLALARYRKHNEIINLLKNKTRTRGIKRHRGTIQPPGL